MAWGTGCCVTSCRRAAGRTDPDVGEWSLLWSAGRWSNNTSRQYPGWTTEKSLWSFPEGEGELGLFLNTVSILIWQNYRVYPGNSEGNHSSQSFFSSKSNSVSVLMLNFVVWFFLIFIFFYIAVKLQNRRLISCYLFRIPNSLYHSSYCPQQ